MPGRAAVLSSRQLMAGPRGSLVFSCHTDPIARLERAQRHQSWWVVSSAFLNAVKRSMPATTKRHPGLTAKPCDHLWRHSLPDRSDHGEHSSGQVRDFAATNSFHIFVDTLERLQ